MARPFGRPVLATEGERRRFVHVVPEAGRTGVEQGAVLVAPARLVVAQGPARGQEWLAGEVAEPFDRPGHGPGDHVVAKRASVEPSLEVAVEREAGAVRVLVEREVAAFAMEPDVDRDADVD